MKCSFGSKTVLGSGHFPQHSLSSLQGHLHSATFRKAQSLFGEGRLPLSQVPCLYIKLYFLPSGGARFKEKTKQHRFRSFVPNQVIQVIHRWISWARSCLYLHSGSCHGSTTWMFLIQPSAKCISFFIFSKEERVWPMKI